MKPNYEVLGDMISALNHLDQAQSEIPKGSIPWVALGSIRRQLLVVMDMEDAQCISRAEDAERDKVDIAKHNGQHGLHCFQCTFAPEATDGR